MTPDGRYVAWVSNAPDLVPDDTNNLQDVFVRDLHTETTLRVVGEGGVQPNGNARDVAISNDGSTLAFTSDATNLVPQDTGSTTDVYRYRIATAELELISITSSGVPGSGPSRTPTVSADGGVIAFLSSADDLVGGDLNGALDAFVHDQDGLTRWSVGTGGVEADAATTFAKISSDGTTLLFQSDAINLGPDTNTPNLWRASAPGVNQRVSLDLDGAPVTSIFSPDISDDGTKVIFASVDLAPAAAASVVVIHDATESRTHLVSTDRFGAPEAGHSPVMSGDGRYVVFEGRVDIDGTRFTVARTLKASFEADVASITPSAVEVGSTEQVTISGDGFFFDAEVATSLRGGVPDGVIFSDVAIVDSSTLTATVTVAADADLGPRDIHAELPGTLGPLTGTIAVPCRSCFEVVPAS